MTREKSRIDTIQFNKIKLIQQLFYNLDNRWSDKYY